MYRWVRVNRLRCGAGGIYPLCWKGGLTVHINKAKHLKPASSWFVRGLSTMDNYKTDPELAAKMAKIQKYTWDFENLAFEGGGAKMIAYAGGCKILEELGILQNCKRFSGTSGGAIAAALLATGHTADEMRELMALPMDDLLLDSSWGYFSFIPNMWRKFGWNAAKGFLDKLRDILKKKTGKKDITFKEVYEIYGNELCVVATNISTQSVEFFHPKTTPDISVALAVRCSVSLPVLLQPVEVTFPTGLKQLYVDGGVVLNYPLHAFDGWGLSMDKEDSFFKKLNKEEYLFGCPADINKRTLGMLLYTFAEDEVMKGEFIKRIESSTLQRPDTALARQRSEEADELIKEYGYVTGIVTASTVFLDVLQEEHQGPGDKITLAAMKKAVERLKTEHPRAMDILFKKKFKLEKVYEYMEARGGELVMNDLIVVMQQHGIRWSQLIFGGVPTNPKSVTDFYSALLNTCMGMSRRVTLKPADPHRTVGIFTDYVHTSDFKLDPKDIDFLVKQGQRGTIQYFEHILKITADKEEPNHMEGIFRPKDDA